MPGKKGEAYEPFWGVIATVFGLADADAPDTEIPIEVAEGENGENYDYADGAYTFTIAI